MQSLTTLKDTSKAVEELGGLQYNKYQKLWRD